MFHHPQLDVTVFKGKFTIKNLGRVLMSKQTLERLAAEVK